MKPLRSNRRTSVWCLLRAAAGDPEPDILLQPPALPSPSVSFVIMQAVPDFVTRASRASRPAKRQVPLLHSAIPERARKRVTAVKCWLLRGRWGGWTGGEKGERK